MTRDEFTAMLRDSIATVLREKVSNGKIVIASNLGIEGLARELANNSAAAPWLDIEAEREGTAQTLAACEEWRADTMEELRNIDAILEAEGIPDTIEGDDEPIELATRIGMLRNKILRPQPTAPAVARGPIALKTCTCPTAVFTCCNCNGLPKEQTNAGTE